MNSTQNTLSPKITALLVLGALSTSMPALGYSDGTYSCKNQTDLPDNIYKLQTASQGGIDAAFVTVTRFYRENPSDPNSAVAESELKGFATISKNKKSEILMIGAMRVDIVDGAVRGCTKTE